MLWLNLALPWENLVALYRKGIIKIPPMLTWPSKSFGKRSKMAKERRIAHLDEEVARRAGIDDMS
jgi:hypothetical protein